MTAETDRLTLLFSSLFECILVRFHVHMLTHSPRRCCLRPMTCSSPNGGEACKAVRERVHLRHVPRNEGVFQDERHITRGSWRSLGGANRLPVGATSIIQPYIKLRCGY